MTALDLRSAATGAVIGLLLLALTFRLAPLLSLPAVWSIGGTATLVCLTGYLRNR